METKQPNARKTSEDSTDRAQQILKLWEGLQAEQKDLLIPRLMADTSISARSSWRPAYMDRKKS